MRRQIKKPTAEQLNIQTGDKLVVTKDGGEQHHCEARSEPWEIVPGRWVVLVTGISGSYV